MGQGASTNLGSSDGEGGTHSGSGTAVKTCYYELLAVSRDATQDDIKKAYKKKALELHPDRNHGNVEEATRLFTGIQAAYEVLSDPQEREWYDSHREQILYGDHDSAVSGGPSHPVSVTTSEEVLEWFSMFAKISYDDDSRNNFYTLAGTAFKKLADEEITAAEQAGEDEPYYPDFGNPRSTHEDWVKQFYAAWGGFKTLKSFSWCDVYRYSDAPDRRVKRIMEKENKKFRDAGIREFDSSVRVRLVATVPFRPELIVEQSFVLFVRKRDPRFIKNTQSEAQRQAALLAASREQATRQRRENLAKLREFKAADWTRTSHGADEDSDGLEEETVEKYECIVCKKTFWSERQMGEHEKSKKHTKNVRALKRQMMKEDKEFDLDRDVREIEKQQEDAPIESSEDEELEELEKPDTTKTNTLHDALNKNLQKLDLTPSKGQGAKSSDPEGNSEATHPPPPPSPTPNKKKKKQKTETETTKAPSQTA
ncbi:unnamed protein product [Tuber aestivum]|uniref:J domain-containing protein n=1 Tax=Tuber aestivum TaxID=59557 RepID=A0A292PUM4_9PEZI|nr:unnamed protein product [Tuber aestivum]